MLASPALAQPSNLPCDFHDRVIDLFARKYQEAPVAVGVANVGGLVEVLATSDGATWTIIVTRPDGWACAVAAGEGWRNLEEALPQGTAL